MSRVRSRVVAFAVVVVACVVATASAVVAALHRPEVAAMKSADNAATTLPFSRIDGPSFLFRDTEVTAAYGHLAILPIAHPDAAPVVEPLQCDRVAFAAGRGLCLRADRGALTTYTLRGFTADGHVLFEQQLPGPPSRARVSPDGRLGATTVFIAGDSYVQTGFSTRTMIVDMSDGHVVRNLEDFSVTRNGVPFHQVDFNFWGVTFTRDGDTFYATLGTRGRTYLVKGSVSAATMTVLRDGVECPSLSPDGTRIAFKKRVTSEPGKIWQLSVLDLGTLQDHSLAETRNVDDQAYWLNDSSVLYGLPHAAAGSGAASMDTWQVPADGSGSPRMLIPNAWSAVLGGS